MAKDKKPVQEIPEEENVITPDEFQELESKEKKKKIGGLFSRIPKDKPQEPRRDFPEPGMKEKDSNSLVISVEKMQAKLETMEGLRQATEEKLSRLSEEIGELRSAILEKEKMFNRVETGFEKVSEIFQELQPKKIREELDRKEDAIERLTAKVESLEMKITDMKKNMSDVLGIMDNIKDIKNVIAISTNISRKMAKIDEDKKETAKIAGKIESIFSEITEKMTEFHDYRDKIEFSSESMHDMMKSMDMLEVRVENSLTKDDMKKIDDRLEQMETDISDKIHIVRDIVDELVSSLKKGGVKELLKEAGKTRMDEINRKFSQTEEYERSVKEVKEGLAKLKEEKNKEIGSIIMEVERLKQAPPLIRMKEVKEQKPAKLKRQSPESEGSAIPRFKPALAPLPDMQPSPEPPQEAIPEYPEEQDIFHLMDQCHGQIDKGDVEGAKRLYGEILTIYEQSKDSPEAEQLYGSIKRLYYRLQIYA